MLDGVATSDHKMVLLVPVCISNICHGHGPEHRYTVENDISLTPILAKVFESLVLKWVDICVKPQIDDRQFGCMAWTCATDVMVELLHRWHEATDLTRLPSKTKAQMASGQGSHQLIEIPAFKKYV